MQTNYTLNSHLVLFFLCSVVVTSCGHAQKQKKTTPNERNTEKSKVMEEYKFDSSMIVILTTEAGNAWFFKDKTDITLTNEELKKIDEILIQCINNYNNEDEVIKFSRSIDLERYKRQYIPFMTLEGQRKVYINCFSIENTFEFDYWKEQLVEVLDGGKYFFNVVINLNDESFENFNINN